METYTILVSWLENRQKNNIKWVGVIKPGDVLCTHSRRLGTEGKEKLTLLNLIIRYLSRDKKTPQKWVGVLKLSYEDFLQTHSRKVETEKRKVDYVEHTVKPDNKGHSKKIKYWFSRPIIY